jgi:1-hydroxycarotenoid 3,4-desaturase
VLTLKQVFEELFSDVGERLEDHLVLTPQHVLARHYWSDGTMLDLDADPATSQRNIEAVFGPEAAREFEAFSVSAKLLFDGFDKPMMQAPTPSLGKLTGHVLRNPKLIPAMAPLSTLAKRLRKQFSEPKLAQLFGRYATYVGGSPYLSPAILSLIWDAEAQGVWTVEGGMHQLAQTIEKLARTFGVTFHYDTHVREIAWIDGRATGVVTDARIFPASAVVFNGDPKALAKGALGKTAESAITAKAVSPRSLSACVYAFSAQVSGPELAHHTVFFGDDPKAEFAALAEGRLPDDPSLYICAQDRGAGKSPNLERFEIILNAPTATQSIETGEDLCRPLIFDRLRQFGLIFSPMPTAAALTTPTGFGALFPHSDGSLYGRSPHGMMAAFHRPSARSPLKGLYLVGGGAHPGAGLPMATLSARHVAEAILSDRISTSRSPRTDTRGGTLTGSATTAPKPSPSSAS